MDLEVVGRHAMLFDDDANASFVNSTAALVDWNSLSIDRYDVRHLLSGPPPPRNRRRPSPLDGDTLESELDRERYLDLPPPSTEVSDQQDGNNNEEPSGGVYNAVPFSYGNTDESQESKHTQAESSFKPPFPVPESLLVKLPPTEKVHQIIAKTATFVSRHGGQSEIVLRVKHGDDPTFGFLMPDHSLHPYFRFLVDHQELLSGNSVEEQSKADNDVRGGALSLLGTVYGSGEDEEGVMENATAFKRKESEEAVVALNKTSTDGSEQKESPLNVKGKDETVTKDSLSLKEKPSLIKRNRSITTVKAGSTTGVKKETDASAAEKLRATLASSSKVELPVVEPPSDMKRVIDKIVEFITKNGRQFESVLAEQDVKHGRFPFLLASHIYHPYYLKVLQKAEKLKSTGKGLISEKHDSSSIDKKAASSRETDSASVGSDIPYDSDRKEKFKMVINKSKKDGQDAPSKAPPAQVGVSVDAAAAAAILQAATRGIKNPTLEIFSKISLNGNRGVPVSEGGHAPSLGSLVSSQPSSSNQKPGQKGEPSVSGRIANVIAKTAAIAAASEADSSEACLTKEQKVKAERLKRAKMFTAMIKAGAAPLKSEPLRALSAEPLGSGFSSSGVEGGKERGGSLVPLEVDISDKTEKSGGDYNERRVKRKYRSRSKRQDEGSREEEEEEEGEKGSSHKHSVKKRRTHHSSNHSRDRHKHRRRHSSSKDRDSHHRRKHDSSSVDELDRRSDYSDSEHHHSQHRRKGRRSRYGYEHDRSSDECRHSRHHHKHDNSSKDEDRHTRCRHKHDSSSEDEDGRYQRLHKHHKSSDDEYLLRSKGSHSAGRGGDLEEGEIGVKSDQSKPSEDNGASRETSVDVVKPESGKGRASSLPTETTSVSDDLRAKIRAMLMATL